MRKKRLLILSTVLFVLLLLVLVFKSSPPSPVYYLKTGREFLQSSFIFGDEDKTNWLLTLAQKRLAEAESLRSKNLDFLAQIQFNQGLKYELEAEELLLKLKDKVNTTYLVDKVNANKELIKTLQPNF